ncbi:MAG: hypothetical protein QOD77_917 [Thermoplasmata archaeon]|nr:hypothetical protein [Thermoplasmata archaeon]
MRALLVLLAALLAAGCISVQDDPTAPPTESPPAAQAPLGVPEPLTGMQFLLNAEGNSTLGIWIEADRDLVYQSGSAGLRIVDVSDPTAPVLVSSGADGTENTRDVEVFLHPNGHRYAVMANGGLASVLLVDVTQPEAPFVVTTVDLPGSHTIAVVPGTAVVYNSRSISTHVPGAGETGQVDILDFTDPAKPTVKVFPFPAVVVTVGGTPRPVTATTCHEMTFNAELHRAYCAGVSDTMIWDTTDPLNPVIQQVIDWPGTNIHHGVWDARNGTLLVLGDEFAGVLTPSPPCSDTAGYPTSALWFFDISDLADPTPVGYFQLEYDQVGAQETPGPTAYCSTHLGDVIDGHDLIVLGWYAGGTVLVDFSDPAAARQVAAVHQAAPTSVWEARYHEGHVYAADSQRGLDVLALV